ncbi:bacteriohemerythrin [Oceanidesulfovibrio marinus]|uniref:Chemotaxis protein n=1 Tax=Oceanidesulfovibrio marinus TaxID=370038 RepID=A0A6P1ZEK9_9BACT|nr:bacteriohemerythrin [Oceanidesulfovibrio marinus]TVM32323.1 chemotaxis protein [Oceanidesulfovibrio marinus]
MALTAVAVLTAGYAIVALPARVFGPVAATQKFAEAAAGGDFSGAPAQAPLELGALQTAVAKLADTFRCECERSENGLSAARNEATELRSQLEKAREENESLTSLLQQLAGGAARARAISGQVASSVEELSHEVEEVNQGVDIQRDRMAEIATAMEEMNATVAEVARNAAEAAGSAAESRSNAQDGADDVRGAVTTISQIRERIMGLKTTMSTLDTQADSIGEVLQMVTEIADQTNLLALNAAIEAARAGEAGRGFAVVADEVRKLAEKTMHATDEVREAVFGIQKVARENVASVESVAEDMDAAASRAEDSGKFMDQIVSHVEGSSLQMDSIATASEEQSATSDEINRAVSEVNDVAVSTATGMARSAAALGSMTGLIGELDSIIREMSDSEHTLTANVSAAGRPLIVWSDKLSVGIDSIDDQHKILVDLINELNEAMKQRKANEAIIDVLDRLKNYVVEHFANEEKLFDRYGYPETKSHKEIHTMFVDKVVEFDKALKAGSVTLSMEIMKFLKDWLTGHIMGTDKKYVPFLKEHGVR